MNKRRMLLITTTLVVLALALALYAAMSVKSQRGAAPGLLNGKLAPCPETPNCVCSEKLDAPEPSVAPFRFTGPAADAMAALRQAVSTAGGVIITEAPGYLAATFTSRVFRFVDDVEFRLAADESTIHVRSASRVGHSDLGANKARINKIRQLLDWQSLDGQSVD